MWTEWMDETSFENCSICVHFHCGNSFILLLLFELHSKEYDSFTQSVYRKAGHLSTALCLLAQLRARILAHFWQTPSASYTQALSYIWHNVQWNSARAVTPIRSIFYHHTLFFLEYLIFAGPQFSLNIIEGYGTCGWLEKLET